VISALSDLRYALPPPENPQNHQQINIHPSPHNALPHPTSSFAQGAHSNNFQGTFIL
jgi:hypothetical protein